MPCLIFPRKPNKTMAISIKYGGIIKKRIAEFKPFAQPSSFCSATALQFAHRANVCWENIIDNMVRKTFFNVS